MKILVFTQYFWPESFIINDLAKTLRDQGHEITVATGKPNYPEGKIFSGYQAKGVQKEMFDGNIEVFRVPLCPRGKGGAKGLLLNYLSFTFSGIFYFPQLLRGRSFDAILVFSGTPSVALAALPLKWIKGAHWALWIQDLWPESLSATGFIRNKMILRVVGWVVRFTYWCADTVFVQSEAFKEPVAKYSSAEKIVYYPNSMLIADQPASSAKPIPDSLRSVLQNNFCVVFAGNIGTAQAVETIIEAAVKIKDLANAKIVLVGSGSMFNWVKQQVEDLNLQNIFLAGRFPPEAMPQIYQMASCLLVTLKADEVFTYVVPSKIQSYLAAGKPIIASLDGEGARVVLEARAGVSCAAEDAEALSLRIREIHRLSPALREQMGTSGKTFFDQNYEMRSQARQFIQILQHRMAVKNDVKTN